MNELAIGVAIFLLICTIIGYCKGFVRILISLLSIILTIMLVYIVTPYISDFLMNNTQMYNTLKEKMVSVFEEDNAKLDNTITANQVMTIESYSVPELLKDALIENNNAEIYQRLMVTIFEQYIGGYIAKLIINIFAFISTFLMITVFLRIIIFSMHIISKLPIISGVNKIVGAFAGFAEGIIIIWVVFLFIMIFCGNTIGNKLLAEIMESSFLTFIFNTNFLMKMLMGFL